MIDTALPTISCIVPTYNRGPILCDTIEMLLNQAVPPHEILVVDQSTLRDPAAEAALELWEKAGSIRRLWQREPNASMARNRGALAATGTVLLFLDDDIRIADTFVAAHASNYLSATVTGVAGQILDGDGAIVTTRNKISSNPEIDWLWFPMRFNQRCITTWMASGNFSVLQEVYIQVGGMDENYFKGAYREESDFAVRYLRRGYFFQFDPAASIYHLASPGLGGTRQSNVYKYWFHMYGFWYFVIGNATRRTLILHLWLGIRYFLLNGLVLRAPWRFPIYFTQWLATMPMALIARMRGARTLSQVRLAPRGWRCLRG